jgi:calcineurin-like phosphoesterase family protein
MSYCQKFYLADLHLAHPRFLEHCSGTRPFFSTEDMDAAIVDRINDRVAKNDILYVLGDFCLSGLPEYAAHLFHSINGRKRLVISNHDLDRKGRLRKTLAALPWDVPPQHSMETTDGVDGSRIYLSHYAHRTWPAMNRGGYHFYGHSHGDMPALGRSRDVGIDVPDMGFGPKTFGELRETLDA